MPRQKKLPKNYPHRYCYLPCLETQLRVPKYIVRIENYYPDGRVKNCGWQVRYCQPSVYFSDGGKSPRPSLRAASAYLASIWNGEKNVYKPRTTARRTNPIKEPGIRLVCRRRSENLVEWYVEAMSPLRGKASRRVYVGTDRTKTMKRLQAAMIKARSYRDGMERALRAEIIT
jgi:hypothetical protein